MADFGKIPYIYRPFTSIKNYLKKLYAKDTNVQRDFTAVADCFFRAEEKQD